MTLSLINLPLPRSYFLIWIAHSITAWLLVLKASVRYQHGDYEHYFPRGWFFLDRFMMDDSDFEWTHWTQKLPRCTAAFLVHSVLFSLVNLLLLTSMLLNAFVYGWIAVACAVAFMIVMLLPILLRRSLIVWCLDAVMLFVLISRWTPVHLSENQAYSLGVFLSYKLLQCTSFCLEKIDHPVRESSKEMLIQLMCYSFYIPYSTTLFVTFHEFGQQMHSRRPISETIRDASFLACRIAFWIVVCQLVLHFFYMHFMISDKWTLERLDLPTLAAVGYTVGQFFHMKYVCIFGLNAVFAKLDGMSPPWPPICISRVALYSRVWRYFDRGLYSFLRNHLYVRLASGRFKKVKRLSAALACFGFVWLWHGANMAFFYWCMMNLVEILIENLAYEFDRAFHILDRLSYAIGARNVRRLLAVLFVPCETLGIFAIIFFLGGFEAGETFLHRLLIDRSFHVQSSYLYLILLGYVFAHCCMDFWLTKH
ncbi:unnamed protein product [Soboliphyme baturini]|uniref:Protein-cysteine N-palmitoyltransferase Rasp n=1 Tax=Soboliphyme baturini TaxID=241478 RepID=A0A3P8DTY1_9BILA|nr:unnamed protein product [Soboliphyme baturini]